jgi:drug/metabolite transporter (DMT)-like permease
LLLVAWNGQDLSALINSHYFKGNVYAIFAGLGWVPCALAQKVNAHRYSSAAIVAPMFAISALITGVYSLFTPVMTGSFSWLAVSFIILTGALGLGLGNHLFARTMRTIPASIGAAAITACPMISLVASALLLHEPVTTYLLIGAPLTCAGIAIAVLSAR